MIPFFLYEASLALFPSPDGNAVQGGAVYWGGPANRLSLTKQNTAVRLAASGDQYETDHQVNENHQLEVGQAWLVREDGADFTAVRGQFYVLQILWAMQRPGRTGFYWYQRTYYGVTCEEVGDASQGTLQSARSMRFRAQRLVTAGGPGPGPGVYAPVAPSGTVQDVLFAHEEPLQTGMYLLGMYRWPPNATAQSVTVTAWRSQNSATVLALEVEGVLTGDTVSLAAGTANTEVQVTQALSRAIPAGSGVRWKVTGAPADVESMAWQCGLVMQLKVNA